MALYSAGAVSAQSKTQFPNGVSVASALVVSAWTQARYSSWLDHFIWQIQASNQVVIVGMDSATAASGVRIVTNYTTDGSYFIAVPRSPRAWNHILVYLEKDTFKPLEAWVNGRYAAITESVAQSGSIYNSSWYYAGFRDANHDGTRAEFAVWSVGTGKPSLGAIAERLSKGESAKNIQLNTLMVYNSARSAAPDYTGVPTLSSAVFTRHPGFLEPDVAKTRRLMTLVHSATGPIISSLGTKLEAGQALVINGGGFGTETGDAAVTISPANDIADAGAVVQTPTAWADGQITVASPTLTGMSDGDTVYVFVTDSAGTDSAGQSVQIADMVLRVGPPVATDDILDTDTGDPIASESLVKVAVMTTDLETVVAAYTDATITAGKFEYDDSSVANITTEDDEFVVVMNGGTSRLGALRATVVDRNED